MGAHFLPPETVTVTDLPEPATLADVRRELEALICTTEIEAAERQAREARDRYMRQRSNAALEWGFAFLDAFDLGPLALDMIDEAIAEMDEDAGDPDLEPWLGVAHFAIGETVTALDAEDDSEEDEGTALERHGQGFVRAGEDDAEDDDGVGDEDSGIGDEDGMQEQLAGWDRCPSLNHSNGGYVG